MLLIHEKNNPILDFLFIDN